MQLRWGPRRRSPRLLALGDEPDLISTLPDDLLLLVLACLGCAAAAARTGVLSRRWRGLWAGLRRIVLRDVPFHSVEPALALVSPPPPTVSLVQIWVPEPAPGCRAPKEHLAVTARVNSLLRAAARLDPEKFSLGLLHGCLFVDLPCFHRATSIVLDLGIHIYGAYPTIRTGVEFPALQTLSLSSCTADVDALLSCCPRLRTLQLADVCLLNDVLRVNSPLLQELKVARATWIIHATIIAPVLKQLYMSLRTCKKFSISIAAPMVENVSWDCHFSGQSIAFGPWQLMEVSLEATAESPPLLDIHSIFMPAEYFDGEEAENFYDEEEENFPGENFMQEIERHMRAVAEFSVLKLHLYTMGHVYGDLAFLLLGMNQIRSSVQRLKVLLHTAAEGKRCSADCPCEPIDWRFQTIALTALEEVEIDGFEGDEHEIDFLKFMFNCTSMLKRITVKLSHGSSLSNFEHRKIYDKFRACAPVEFYVSFTSDEYMFCRLD